MSLYERIVELHGRRPWGSVLDAGTGRASMRWLLGLDSERWTAVTAATSMAEQARAEIGDRMREVDRLVVGNWIDPELLAGERYDTVLADYLLGAIEGFAPYWQGRLFERLRPLVGGRLYVVGLEPYVHGVPTEPEGAMVNRIGRLRDACLLLAGDQPYREYPLDWAIERLQGARFRVVDAERIPIRYGERFVHSQLDMCSRALGRLRDRTAAVALLAHVEDLRRQALALIRQVGGLRHGHDYILVAEPV
ncbi:SAM-dependent methyltransferase [Luteimonas sp. SDU82]|uniref:SAM-dependent methyltransferase n=1 Tax=Luteimonas sp. SDU82 TaxID=3422592 RepID=UPI003EB6B701